LKFRESINNENFVIKDRERICQMVIEKYEKAERVRVDSFLESERGRGGFGHTGKE
jgi:dUTP pyrophosphatase